MMHCVTIAGKNEGKSCMFSVRTFHKRLAQEPQSAISTQLISETEYSVQYSSKTRKKMVYQRCRDWGYTYVHDYLTYMIHKGESIETRRRRRRFTKARARKREDDHAAGSLVHNK
ncbi:hypothetical protein MtrunA17_Chr2g0297091 [Medicago truncatula]|nr:unknown [Medicago truncatula]RHN73312.1 hypothetical protein MtrunA17_Chr2g0297091 [Medicago truncatula]